MRTTFVLPVRTRFIQTHFYLKKSWLRKDRAKVVTVANEFTGLIAKINNAVRNDRNLRLALTSILAIHKQRIFSGGYDGRGVKIGTYSTKPTSIPRDRQARDTGRTHFKGGYAEYKRAIGKNPGYVNLRNTDQMQMDYGIVGSNLSYGFGFQNSANFQKMKWMERKYFRDIAITSNNELERLADILVNQLIRSL